MGSFKWAYYKRSSFLDSIVYQTKQKSARRNIMSVIVAIVIAFLISFIIITATGTKADAFFYIFQGVFSDDQFAQSFCVQMCTYAVAALAFSFCMKVGIFNIGISGQMLAGASTAFFIILSFPPSSQNLAGGWILTIIFAVLGSTFVALITGLLKIYCRVNEVVTGILLNWIILYIVGAIMQTNGADGTKLFLDEGAWSNGQFYSKTISNAFAFTQNGQFYGWGFSLGITLICIIVVWVLLKFTVYGHKLKTMGHSMNVAKNFGYNQKMLQLSAFLISGILSGILAVIVFTASMTPRLSFQGMGGVGLTSTPSQGFDGIAIGLIALNNPLGILLVSFVFSFPDAGAGIAGLTTNTIQLVMGIIMYIVAIYTLLNYFKPWRWFMNYYHGKCNRENYMNLENKVFDLNEKYCFTKKKIYKKFEYEYLKKKLNISDNSKPSVLGLMFYRICWYFTKFFNTKLHDEIETLNANYQFDRLKLSDSFKLQAIDNLVNYYSQDNLSNSLTKRIAFNHHKYLILNWCREMNMNKSDYSVLKQTINDIEMKRMGGGV
ncbi:MAG: ABC transporter permease [Malacoplasma sp.]|nr:ABC transporter permease [Malacoplasma sp.]